MTLARSMSARPAAESTLSEVVFENAGANFLASGIATFGQVFSAGDVEEGSALRAWIGGQLAIVQMDVKTTHADGSVDMAVLSVQRPAMETGAMLDVVLHLAPEFAPEPPDLNIMAGLRGHSFRVNLRIGDEPLQRINVLAELRAALLDGSASTWLAGPLAVQSRVEVELAGSLRMVFDVTSYAGGSFSVEAQFKNDAAMEADGGRVVYRLAVVMDGEVVARERINQGQYQNWHRSFSLDGEDGGQGTGGLNIRHDVDHLADTGAVARYNSTVGVQEARLEAWGAAAAAPGATAPLAVNGVQQFMPGTGGRDDIGFTTAANTAWLMTGDGALA